MPCVIQAKEHAPVIQIGSQRKQTLHPSLSTCGAVLSHPCGGSVGVRVWWCWRIWSFWKFSGWFSSAWHYTLAFWGSMFHTLGHSCAMLQNRHCFWHSGEVDVASQQAIAWTSKLVIYHLYIHLFIHTIFAFIQEQCFGRQWVRISHHYGFGHVVTGSPEVPSLEHGFWRVFT